MYLVESRRSFPGVHAAVPRIAKHWRGKPADLHSSVYES